MGDDKIKNKKGKGPGAIARLIDRTIKTAQYCWTGVWRDNRKTMKVRVIKTLNLSVRTFMDGNLQIMSMSLTYRTVLAIIPALAMVFAICRGFGFQNLLADGLNDFMPGQQKVVGMMLGFVDSYLRQASQGLFIGVGLVMLLWTVISLLSSIEDSFNEIWDIKQSRSLYQKATDYIAICLVIPILIVCSSGVSIFMSTISDSLNLPFLTPLLDIVLDFSPVLLYAIAFTLSFLLIPNAKIDIKYAAISGAICAVMFTILQYLFISGQVYVSNYNAIYGTFSFVPIMLVWLQFSWLIVLFGCVLTYSLQNVFSLNFLTDPEKLSAQYSRQITAVMAAIIVQTTLKGATPPSATEIARETTLPARLVNERIALMSKAELIYIVKVGDSSTGVAATPALINMNLTELFEKIENSGDSDFVPGFEQRYSSLIADVARWTESSYANTPDIMLRNLPVHLASGRIARSNKSTDKT